VTSELSIRPATPADAEQLSFFAAAIFRETFGPDNNPTDLELYLSEAYSPEKQAAEIADPNGVVLLAEIVTSETGATPRETGAKLAGYAHLVQSEPAASVTGPAPVELSRFYVSPEWHGHGIAQKLMHAVVDTARERGAGTLWLGVWEHNPRAIAFYRKCGFEQIGEKTFLLGTDLQNDLVFARTL